MTLMGRRSREVYRVYSEDEFLDGAAQEFLDGVEPGSAAGDGRDVVSGGGERRLRRFAGAAMLVGAVGTVGGVVAVHVVRNSRGAVGRSRGHSLAGASRTYLPEYPARGPVEYAGRRGSAARPHPVASRVSHHPAPRRARLRSVGGDPGVRATRPGGPHGFGGRALTGMRTPGRPGMRWLVGTRSHVAPIEARPPAVASRPAAEIVVAAASVASSSSPAHPEFGFER